MCSSSKHGMFDLFFLLQQDTLVMDSENLVRLSTLRSKIFVLRSTKRVVRAQLKKVYGTGQSVNGVALDFWPTLVPGRYHKVK